MKLHPLAYWLLMALAIHALVLPAHADVRELNLRNCNAQKSHDIREAVRFLRRYQKVLKNDFEFDGRLPRAERRVKRRLDRLVDDMRITCDRSIRCRDNTLGRGFALGPRIFICYNNHVDNDLGYCRLVRTVAHEFGHWIGMTANIGHNEGFESGAFDPVIRFEMMAGDLCAQAGLEQPLPLDMTTSLTIPECNTVAEPGLQVFARKRYQGCPRQIEPAESMPNLRTIGRDKAISSVRVVGRPWEVCLGRDYTDWCHVLASDLDDLGLLDINNKIESLRPYTAYSDGIVVHRKRDQQGGYRNYTASVANLKGSGINDEISSVEVLTGRWRLCGKKDYTGRCVTLEPGSTLNLRGTNLNNKVTSIQRL